MPRIDLSDDCKEYINIKEIVKTITREDIRAYTKRKIYYNLKYHFTACEMGKYAEMQISYLEDYLTNMGYKIISEHKFDSENFDLKSEINKLKKQNLALKHNVSKLQKQVNSMENLNVNTTKNSNVRTWNSKDIIKRINK